MPPVQNSVQSLSIWLRSVSGDHATAFLSGCGGWKDSRMNAQDDEARRPAPSSGNRPSMLSVCRVVNGGS